MDYGSLIVDLDPRTPAIEAFRMLRTNLQYTNVDKRVQTIVITSSDMGEGKTTTAANLAIALAQADKRTLFVGADLRKPRAYKIFDVDHSVGLTTLISRDLSYMDAIEKIESEDNLFIIPAGPIPPNPSELLQSKRMKELLDEFKAEFDYVIIDAPPINYVSDGSILAAISDGVILVVEARKTTKESARLAVKALEIVGAHILGCVLTKAKVSNSKYYYE